MNLDEMPAVRHRIKYRNENLYVVVVLNDAGQPYEIFAEHATRGDYKIQYMLASWDCLTRFISTALQILPLSETIKHLERSTRQAGDLPAIILNILSKYQTSDEDKNITL